MITENTSALETLVALKVQQTQLAETSVNPIGSVASEPTYLIPTPGPQLTAPLATQGTEVGSFGTEENIPNFERRRKAAHILLFENMSASGQVRYVKEALDQGGYFYLDVGSATGWFRNQLLASQEWDLIIAAAEARRDFGGEYFELINQRLESGAAAIIETWDIDQAPNGKVDALLTNCGVKFDSDWFEPVLRVFFWLVPDHPIFHLPNEIPPFTNAHHLWRGDIGDLLDIRYRAGQPVGDARLLAGANPGLLDQHGALAVCLENRLVLQTFSSHEYNDYDVIHLWQNYIYHTLQGRFAHQSVSLLPTPRGDEPLQPTATGSGATGMAAQPNCQGIVSVQIAAPVIIAPQLFEHNPAGQFVIVDLQLKNLSPAPFQIWDDDYRLQGYIGDQPMSYPIHKAATSYLFNQQPNNLWQDLLFPAQDWETRLAFDVDPRLEGRELVISPGAEVSEPLCELRIMLP